MPKEVVNFKHRGGHQGSHPNEEGVLLGCVIPEDSGGSCKVPRGLNGCSFCRERGKAAGLGEVRRRLGQGQSISTKVFPEILLPPQEGETGLGV